MDAAFKNLAIEFFKKYDKNKTDFIELVELNKLVKDTAKEINIPAPDDMEIEEMLIQYDLNKDNKISKEEFLKLFEVIYEMKKNK